MQRPQPPTVFIVGLGGLGSVVLELLAREPVPIRILVGSRNLARATARCNLARLAARAQGFTPALSCLALDLDAEEATASTIARESPDVIVCTATRQSWWLPHRLPAPQAEVIRAAGFGVWLPVHLALPLKLMRALRLAHYSGLTLMTPFPDVVNCVLGCLDLAPTCGVGNVDEIATKVRALAADRLDLPAHELDVSLVAHHALDRAAFGAVRGSLPPYFLRIEHRGRDVTQDAGGPDVVVAPYPITPGPATHFLTAGSTIRLLRALLGDTESRLHAPGPNGLPGGYPVVASRAGIRVDSITGLSLAQAIDINERSHRFDGIERIDPDGSVEFVPAGADVLRRELGYVCDRLPPAEIEGRANELLARFREYATRFGVTLDETIS